jgi:hypothetical protein
MGAMSANPTEKEQPPSLVGGHAQYAKGYVTEMVGKAMGNKEWEESEKRTTECGIEEMKGCLLSISPKFLSLHSMFLHFMQQKAYRFYSRSIPKINFCIERCSWLADSSLGCQRTETGRAHANDSGRKD